MFFRQLVSRRLEPDPGVKDRIIVEEAIYTFVLGDSQDDDWIFRYEYRNKSDEDRPHSHIHVNAVHANNPDFKYKDIHLPTGRLSMEQILAHLILEYGIEPKPEVAATIIEELAESHYGFTRRRTDLNNPPFP